VEAAIGEVVVVVAGVEAAGNAGDLLDWPPRFEPGRSR